MDINLKRALSIIHHLIAVKQRQMISANTSQETMQGFTDDLEYLLVLVIQNPDNLQKFEEYLDYFLKEYNCEYVKNLKSIWGEY